MPSYRGLTWDHPRGIDALAASVKHPSPSGVDIDIDWSTHSLAGFEAASIEDIAREYDLLVIDHPHLGTALAHDALAPLDDYFDADSVEALRLASIGSTLDSYRLEGSLWALPIDAAAQVAVSSRALDEPAPRDWDEVEGLSVRHPVALSLAGPHALATFASLCCAFGEPPASGEGFVSAELGAAMLERLTSLAGRAPRGSTALDPIQMLALMATTDEIAYVPLVFGYVGSSTEAGGGLRFCDAPTAPGGDRHGSILGGAGLAFSRHCPVSEELVAYARWLVSDATQRTFIPAHSGQPSARAAWNDEEVDRVSCGFYAGTRRTLEQAWVRPRYDGYIAFQVQASALVRSAVEGRVSAPTAVTRLNELHRRSMSPATPVGAAS